MKIDRLMSELAAFHLDECFWHYEEDWCDMERGEGHKVKRLVLDVYPKIFSSNDLQDLFMAKLEESAIEYDKENE